MTLYLSREQKHNSNCILHQFLRLNVMIYFFQPSELVHSRSMHVYAPERGGGYVDTACWHGILLEGCSLASRCSKALLYCGSEGIKNNDND